MKVLSTLFNSWMLAGLALVIITPIALSGFWTKTGWGISDWDYYFSVHENYRQAILKYHVFPFWNPATCGGTAGLGDPEFPVVTPTFPLELIFGVPNGLRLAIWLATAIGALGMLILGKRLGLSPWAATLAALGASFGSVNLLEIVEGHQNIFAAMWLPWIFWAWLGSYKDYKAPSGTWFKAALRSSCRNQVLTAIFLALTFYQGGIYLLMYTALALLTLLIFMPDRKKAFLVTLYAGVIALGLAAFKLIPTLLWLRQFQDQAYASSAFTLPYLKEILFGRYLHGTQVFAAQEEGWHEYGAYIGPVIAALAIVSLTAIRRRLVWTLWAGALLAIFLSASGPLLKPFFDQVAFIPRSNISRIILFAIIPLSLLAGIGLDNLRAWSGRKWAPIVSLMIIFLVGFDLLSLANALSQQAFVVPPVPTEELPKLAPAPIAFTPQTFSTRVAGVDYGRSYAATLRGYGTMNYCSVIGPTSMARTIYDEKGTNNIILVKNDQAKFDVINWSPNEVRVSITTPAATEVALNSNYAKGWLVNSTPAEIVDGRVGTHVPAGTSDITFHYRSPGWLIGMIITLATLLFYGIRYAMSPERAA